MVVPVFGSFSFLSLSSAAEAALETPEAATAPITAASAEKNYIRKLRGSHLSLAVRVSVTSIFTGISWFSITTWSSMSFSLAKPTETTLLTANNLS